MPRWLMFTIFFTVFLSIWGSANYYIYRRGLEALPGNVRLLRAYRIAFLFLATAWIAGRFMENAGPMLITPVFNWAGSVWLGFASMLFLICLAIDIIRLGNLAFHYFPASWTEDPQRIRFITGMIVFGFVSLVNIGGAVNACIVRTRRLEITVNKKADSLSSLKVAVASDFHIGTVVGTGRLKKIVDAINAANPDLILLPGDLVDEGVKPGQHDRMCALLKSLKARYGVYGCTGNHEYIVGLEKSIPFLEHCGVVMLRDRMVTIDNIFQLAGRDDVSRSHMHPDGARAPLEEILKDRRDDMPLILMDHSPFKLEQAMHNGVDLQVSGHTHNGQLWPFNYITGMIFEQDWGYLRKGDTHYYISCGAGTWGPPVRTNSAPEIVVIEIRFKKEVRGQRLEVSIPEEAGSEPE